MIKKVLVVGGGPAGMMAAASAAENGAQVILVEKKRELGKKLAISGKGRCNFTSAVDDIGSFITAYAGNGRFLYSALSELSNKDLIDFFARRGVKSKVERGQRVFPESDDAADIVGVLYDNLKHTGVEILTSQRVTAIHKEGSRITGIQTEKGKIEADAVIIASGGMSYPGTGSTGDGYEWGRTVGHHIIEPRPALVPLITSEEWIQEVQGLSLKNVKVSAFQADGKKINEGFGEMLFTHFGVSGPIILTLSRDIGEYLHYHKQSVKLLIDLKPALDEEKLDDRLCRDLAKYSRRQFKNSLADLLPNKLIPLIIKLSKIDGEKECNQINRSERKSLLHLLKNLELTIVDTRPIAEAIVTAGGVDVKEINPRTMESKLIRGLFFAGEILDVDGYTGGYNLQAAFSTGYLAGKNAACAL